MPLLVNSVPNLAQGVSQQPDNLRYPGQCDEQINAWATVVEGLKKRPNTNYVKNIDTDGTANIFTHFVKRDETNQYAIVVSLGGVSAYDVSLGTSIPVTVTSIANSYLSLGTSVTDPLNDLRALTVADYTFLVNKRKTVAINTDADLKSKDIRNDEGKYEALVFVKLGDYEKTYDIYLDGKVVPFGGGVHNDFDPGSGHTYKSGAASNNNAEFADTEYIATHLEQVLNGYLGSEGTVTGTTLSGGSGFTDTGATSIASFNSKAGHVTTTYEFFIDQYQTSAHTTKIGFGAKGSVIFKNGSVQSHELTQQGNGYDGTLASDTYKLTIRQHELRTTRPARDFSEFETTSTKTDITSATPDFIIPLFTPTVLSSDSNYEVQREGAVIKVLGTSDFSIRTEDGLANQGLGVAYKEVDSITDLPKHCFNDFRVRVRGDADIAQDDYYVRFQTKDREDYGEGSWVEIAGWTNDVRSAKPPEGIDTTVSGETMPVTLVPEFDATGKVSKFFLQTPDELSNIVKNNGVIYKAIEGHESSSDNEPGTGADWDEYWVVRTDYTDAPAWVTGRRYNSAGYGYSARAAGDDFTNPFPSFVGQTINDAFFFKNRLGFLTDNAVIFSEADNYFNFFRTTTQQLLDSAPIDVGLSHTKVAILQHAIPFQEKLMLFSKQSQFVLRGADILSPKTVAISPVTEYDISDSVEPVALGNYIYFTFKRNDFEGLYEYFVDNNTELFDAEEVTQQVPKYIPNNVRKIAGSQQENTICIGVDSDLKTLYVYKYFWSNKEKIQSAWMKFTFDRDVVGFDFIDSKLYMITKDTEGLHLEFLTLEDGLKDEGLDYPLLLDSRVDGNDVTVAAYDASTKTTRISGIPYNVSLGTDIELYTKIGTQRAITMVNNTTVDVTGALASYVSNGGTVYKCVHTDPDTQVHTSTAATEPGTGADWTDYWVVSTDFSSATAWALGKTYNDDTYFVIGKPYNMTYRFSDQSLKQPTERGGRSASDYTYQTIRNGSINYADTGHFVVEVTPEYRDTYKYVFNPDITGANLLLNEFVPQDGHFRFAVQGQPDKVTIEVKSDSALPCKLLAAEFESMVVPRSKRYGS
jgi:hypothetical protein